MSPAKAIRWWPPIGLLAMLVLGWAVSGGPTALDKTVLHNIYESGQPRWLLIFTDWRFLVPVIVACLVVALYRRQWRLAIVAATFPLLASLAVDALKPLFGRYKGDGYAYPSGHSTVVIVVMGIVVLIAGARLWAIATAITVSLLGILGMIFCGYHYLTDTVGSVLLGTSLVCIAAVIAAPRYSQTSRS